VRFLVVGVPYHSDYLTGVTEAVMQDLDCVELWKPEDLGISVFNTEDGSDLCKTSGSITSILCDLIFTKPIHWTTATQFPESATHALDFGPGGLSGIGPLTAKNFEGRGVRVIVIGDRGKGDVELYSSSSVQYEEWWSKKWASRLVKTRLVFSAFEFMLS
jgi:fatty acid synthase subunit alpha, fungi type